jgi:arabinofuranosyltransferase
MCAAPVLFLAGTAWSHRWVAEDANIYFRVVANLHDGLGPVWNAGERVEAYTGPLWLGVLWVTSSVFGFVPLEWIAVVLGGLATLAGCAAAARGSWLLWRGTGRTGVALPLGLLLIAALRPMWEFATSGLETGLIFLWLGGCFWALARLVRGSSAPTPVAVAIGAGLLVRPDLAIFALGFMIALLVVADRQVRLGRVRLVAWALLLPVTYQLFRMGYFAALEPNTALAKEAGLADWSRGWTYLWQFFEPYLLFLPLVLLAAYVSLELREGPRPPRPTAVVALAPVAGGLLHGLYIVRLGGDFMHARMLLPSLFGLLLPVTVVIARRRALRLALGFAVVSWAIVCAAALHSDKDPFGANRAKITLHDWRSSVRVRNGLALRRLAEDRRALVLRVPLTRPRLRIDGVPRGSSPAPVVAGALTIGLLGYAAGPHVHVVDQLGITDPLGARTRLGPIRIPRADFGYPPDPSPYYSLPKRDTAGHEKYLPTEWIVARFAPVTVDRLRGVHLLSSPGIAAARRTLRCPRLRTLLQAVEGPLTLDRFVSNLGQSFSLTGLRFPADPVAAERELCAE